VTEIFESPRELLAFVCGMRRDWDPDETWTAILAARTAQYGWPRIVRALIDLALRDEPTPTRPRELWDDVRGLRSLPGTGAPLDPGVKERLIADCQAVTDSYRHGTTGGQPVLAEGRDP
jgi:hypothetical protein